MTDAVTAVAIFLLGALLTWLIGLGLVCLALIKPPRLAGGRALARLGRLTPEDMGMDYEEMNFRVRDAAGNGEIAIAGWWIAGRGQRSEVRDQQVPANYKLTSDLCPLTSTVVILHGFADSKIGSIAWAPLWRELGFNVLAIDLRAHGESGGSFSSAGFYEREDVSQVIDQLRREKPEATQKIVLFGLSLGAAVAAAVAAQQEDIDAVVLDSPFRDYRRAVVVHARRRRLPGKFVVLPALWLAEVMLGGSTDEVKPARTIQQIKAPVLIITGDADPFCTLDDLEVLGVPYHVIADSGHLYAYVNEPEKYKKMIADFLKEHRDRVARQAPASS